jgi:protein involved in polysaccharide export with SLBB domain
MRCIAMRSRAGAMAARSAAVLLAAALCGCASGKASTPHSMVAPAPDTTLGPGDTFEISVYGEKELSGKHQVADDGQINFPLVGLIVVSGKGPNEAARAIEEALRTKGVLRNPSVSLYVIDYASKRISVFGAVAHPGSFPITAGMTVVQAISLAGGLTPLAAANETIVTRRGGEKLQRFKIEVGEVAEGNRDDFSLQAGDIVFVPERVF